MNPSACTSTGVQDGMGPFFVSWDTGRYRLIRADGSQAVGGDLGPIGTLDDDELADAVAAGTAIATAILAQEATQRELGNIVLGSSLASSA